MLSCPVKLLDLFQCSSTSVVFNALEISTGGRTVSGNNSGSELSMLFVGEGSSFEGKKSDKNPSIDNEEFADRRQDIVKNCIS